MKLGIHGLLPPSVVDIDTQIARLVKNYSYETTDLGRYSFLMALYERNETLFYRMVQSDVKKYMPIIYTPTVGLACQKFGEIFKRPRGLYITIRDRGNIASILQNWHEKEVKVWKLHVLKKFSSESRLNLTNVLLLRPERLTDIIVKIVFSVDSETQTVV